MSDLNTSSSEGAVPQSPIAGVVIGNMGVPIILAGVEVDGVVAEPARPGEMVKVWTRLAITSDHSPFHRIADNLAAIIRHHTQAIGATLDLERAKVVLLVIRPDHTAELWVDTAAMCINVMTKRNLKAGEAVLESDIVDVAAMAFPLVKIGKDDKVVCILRQDWRFGIYFDFNPDKNLSVDEFNRALGSLYRGLKYRHIYDAIEQPEIFERLVHSGWFPFAEIITSEFRQLVQACEAGFDLKEVEERIVSNFDPPRLERMLARWLAKPHFASREAVLRSAVKNFAAKDPVAVVKTVLTEIEGVLNAAHRASHGHGAKTKELLKFATASAEQKAGGPHTLLLPHAFAKYLEDRTYANFDPTKDQGHASSRHAVGHGAAAADSYTQVAALQALLTLDQFAFST